MFCGHSVSLCVGHTCKQCRNGRTDRDVVWEAAWCEPSNRVLDGGALAPPGKYDGAMFVAAVMRDVDIINMATGLAQTRG